MSGDCEASVCGGQIAFGPPGGDVTGLGYCSTCVPSSQTDHGVEWDTAWDDGQVNELLFEDGLS